MENSRLKLSYFDARGVAETTRYMLAVTKTPYEDFRYGFTFGTPGDFSTVQRPEFDAAKAAGKLDANLGRLPLLEVDGTVIGQSKTIERFVAKRVGMMGWNTVWKSTSESGASRRRVDGVEVDATAPREI